MFKYSNTGAVAHSASFVLSWGRSWSKRDVTDITAWTHAAATLLLNWQSASGLLWELHFTDKSYFGESRVEASTTRHINRRFSLGHGRVHQISFKFKRFTSDLHRLLDHIKGAGCGFLFTSLCVFRGWTCTTCGGTIRNSVAHFYWSTSSGNVLEHAGKKKKAGTPQASENGKRQFWTENTRSFKEIMIKLIDMYVIKTHV